MWGLDHSKLTRQYIAKTLRAIPPAADPLKLIRAINQKHGWSEKDMEALNRMSSKQVLQLLSSQEHDLISQVHTLLKSWRGLNGLQGEFAQKLDAGLATLKKRSKLNALRVENLFRSD
jgi:hypothetical protein